MPHFDKPQSVVNPSGYAGDLLPEEAWNLLAEEPKALLVDVRTSAEWTFVGLPDLSAVGKEPMLIPWQELPDMALNPDFGQMIERVSAAKGMDRANPLIFLCRSGARSRAAAIEMTRRGYSSCFNLAGGFEGDLDPMGHRGTRNGWKASGLPWRQG